jgi:hypothetical protein
MGDLDRSGVTELRRGSAEKSPKAVIALQVLRTMSTRQK